MRFEDFKVGDKVYIREDLKVYEIYGGFMFMEHMKKGEQRIVDIYDEFSFLIKGEPFIYTSKMIDWEKTSWLYLYIQNDRLGENKQALNKATINNIKPNHYKLNIKGIDLEVKDIMQEVMGKEQYKGFLYGNAIKYILRAYKKNGVEDLEKARKYIGWLIEQEK
jgi:hypothetical protein